MTTQAVRIVMTMNQAKTWFNAKPALTKSERVELRFLKRYGAFVRKESSDSIKRRKSASQPGHAPHSHRGDLKRNIVFVADPGSMNVWIFPTVFRQTIDTPSKLEHSGRVRVPRDITKFRKRRGRKGPRGGKTRREVIKKGAYKIEERPYMRPAAQRVNQQLDGIWAYARK